MSRRAILVAAMLSGLAVSLHAQVNGYARVTGIAGATLTIGAVNEEFSWSSCDLSDPRLGQCPRV